MWRKPTPCARSDRWGRAAGEAIVDQRELIKRARQGDHEAFAVLVDGAIRRLDAPARLIVRDPELAQDAVHESMSRSDRSAVPSRRLVDLQGLVGNRRVHIALRWTTIPVPGASRVLRSWACFVRGLTVGWDLTRCLPLGRGGILTNRGRPRQSHCVVIGNPVGANMVSGHGHRGEGARRSAWRSVT